MPASLNRLSVIKTNPLKDCLSQEQTRTKAEIPINHTTGPEFITQFQSQETYPRCASFNKDGCQTVSLPYSQSWGPIRDYLKKCVIIINTSLKKVSPPKSDYTSSHKQTTSIIIYKQSKNCPAHWTTL